VPEYKIIDNVHHANIFLHAGMKLETGKLIEKVTHMQSNGLALVDLDR